MIRAMCVFGILCLIAIEVAAQDLRRIDEISTSDRGGRLYLEDWDSDGRLELIRCDTVGEYEISSAGKSLKFTQIYEARDGRWAIDRAFIHRCLHAFERNLLLLNVFDDGFDDDGAVAVIAHVVGELDATEQRVGIGIGDFAFFYEHFQRCLNTFARPAEGKGVVVAHHDVVAGGGCDLGDPAPHCAGTQYAYCVHCMWLVAADLKIWSI